MRRWSRHARELEQAVAALGKQLRTMSYVELAHHDRENSEFTIDGRRASMAVLVEQADAELRVVILGSVDAALLGRHVAVYGFYKVQDESTRDMPDEEYSDYD